MKRVHITKISSPKKKIIGFTLWNQCDFLQGETFKFADILAHHKIPYLFEY